MLRRPSLLLTLPTRGRPWRKRDTFHPIHAAFKPAQEAEIDYSSLDLEYLPTYEPVGFISKIGWSKPPLEKPNLPFEVERTNIGAGLPVYTDYKSGRTKVVTILRRCRGDIATLRSEMEKVCGQPVK
eukprot:gene51643-69110_t